MRRAALAGLLLASSTAFGFAGGAPGNAGNGGGTCNDCHNGGTAPKSVTITGPGSLLVGELATYDVVVVSGATGQKSAGVDVAASAGKLSVHAGMPATKVANGEIVQNGTAASNTDTVTFHFDFTAPAQAGVVTLFGDGLSANGDSGTGGDSGLTTKLMVTVTEPPMDMAEPVDFAGVDLIGVDFSVPPPPDMTTAMDAISAASDMAVKPPGDEPRWGCGCGLGGRARAPASLVVVLLLAVGVRARARARARARG